MSIYGHRAMAHWKRARAAESALVEDPTGFVTRLGQEIGAEVERRRHNLEMATGAGQSEGFLVDLAALNSKRAQALRTETGTEPGAGRRDVGTGFEKSEVREGSLE
ncbi:hypothetical protein [Actinokineospora iranica]|nr:hypothetical protein [Actinokineospora iranica]